jgi:hypothetical protein
VKGLILIGSELLPLPILLPPPIKPLALLLFEVLKSPAAPTPIGGKLAPNEPSTELSFD